jgi:hypothetical protein
MVQSKKKKIIKLRVPKKKENERTSAYFHNWLGNINIQCSAG